jgi:C1A family cysteine protease
MCDQLISDVPKHKWTFKFEAPKTAHATGLLKKKNLERVERIDFSFKNLDVPVPGAFDLTAITPLSPILDQGQCGSCVYHSVTSNFADSWLLRGQNFGSLNQISAEFLLTSPLDQGAKCNGSYFMATAPATANGMPLYSDCPYNMGRRGCSSGVSLHGKSVSERLIDTSAKSIMQALNQKYPVSNTIGANGTFQGYQGGVFNACANVGTNHETLILGYDCETAKDASGNCVFDANGNLAANVGYWKIRNSWGTGWGEQGFYRIKITDSRGRLCNNVAQEVGVIETGVTPPAPIPPVPPAPPTPSFDWSKVWSVLKAIGQVISALAGIVALILVLKKK